MLLRRCTDFPHQCEFYIGLCVQSAKKAVAEMHLKAAERVCVCVCVCGRALLCHHGVARNEACHMPQCLHSLRHSL